MWSLYDYKFCCLSCWIESNYRFSFAWLDTWFQCIFSCDITKRLVWNFAWMKWCACCVMWQFYLYSLKFNTGFLYTLRNVRYILELSRNLISVGRLEKSDFFGKIGDGILKLVKDVLVSMKETRKNDVYITIGEVIKGLYSSSFLLSPITHINGTINCTFGY